MPTIEHQYRLKLVSDAQPATGLGSESINSLVPRNHLQNVIIPGSHIKGLMRDNLLEMQDHLGWHPEWISCLLGAPGESVASKYSIHFQDATMVLPPHAANPTFRVSRTAIGAEGVARDHSLRTSELIRAGSEFLGNVHVTWTNGQEAPDADVLNQLWQLALLSISAIGGTRSRGCGACIITLPTALNIGETLQELSLRLKEPPQAQAEVSATDISHKLSHEQDGCSRNDGRPSTLIDLIFEASSPVCCPEFADKTNTIRSGFAIPSSAVQGVLLHRLAEVGLADVLFEDARFRAWPLLPVATQRSEYSQPDELPIPIRVSLTHRAAKFALHDNYSADHFQDRAIEPYQFDQVPHGAPLKAFDGVLLCNAQAGVALWKASAMPHVFTSHGVSRDLEADNKRNLFTVDSIAPLVWRGCLAVPAEHADAIVATINQHPRVRFGKGRSVRGAGKLNARVIPTSRLFETGGPHEHDVLVVQSPILIPATPGKASADAVLEATIKQWAQLHDLELPAIKSVCATASIQFGWNRNARTGFLQARHVIDPGSTIELAGPITAGISQALLLGVGPGRRSGFGAVAVHPGRATQLYQPPNNAPSKSSPPGLCEALRLVLDTSQKIAVFPSVSQVRALQQIAEQNSPKDALAYFDSQYRDRSDSIRATWEPLKNLIEALLGSKKFSQTVASRALTTLCHLASENRDKSQSKEAVS